MAFSWKKAQKDNLKALKERKHTLERHGADCKHVKHQIEKLERKINV